jgi:hypothetical protein
VSIQTPFFPPPANTAGCSMFTIVSSRSRSTMSSPVSTAARRGSANWLSPASAISVLRRPFWPYEQAGDEEQPASLFRFSRGMRRDPRQRRSPELIGQVRICGNPGRATALGDPARLRSDTGSDRTDTGSDRTPAPIDTGSDRHRLRSLCLNKSPIPPGPRPRGAARALPETRGRRRHPRRRRRSRPSR